MNNALELYLQILQIYVQHLKNVIIFEICQHLFFFHLIGHIFIVNTLHKRAYNKKIQYFLEIN
jgi:hypothetical protein